MTVYILAILVCLIFSGFFSAASTSLSGKNRRSTPNATAERTAHLMMPLKLSSPPVNARPSHIAATQISGIGEGLRICFFLGG